MLLFSSLLIVLGAQSTATAQSRSTPSLVVQVGVFSYGPDGKPQAAAYDTTLEAESFQYVARCAIGGGNRPIPENATDAWRVSGKIQSVSADEAIVRVDWQRLRANGVAVTSPGGSVQLTLHDGDRVPLDAALPDATPGCGGRTIGFEARFGPRPGWMVGPGGSLAESPPVTIMRGADGRAGAGAGSGAGGGSGGGSSRAVHGQKTDTIEPGEFNADLWLVKTDARRLDNPDFNLQGLVLEKVHGPAPFAFSPFTIETPSGSASMQISGLLRVVTEDGRRQLVFTATRTVKYSSSAGSDVGTSTTKNPMDGADDVFSFELPPMRVRNSSATLPEQLSVRVRIR
jgi:hypothetical protein